MPRLIKRLLERNAYTIAILLSLFVAFVSLFSLKEIAQIKMQNSDKFGHLIAYFLLSYSWFFAIKNRFNTLLIITILIFYGIIIEVLQEVLTSNRQADIMDILANTVGIVLASLVYKKIHLKYTGY